MATGCGDGKARLFDTVKGTPLREVNAHSVPNNEGAVYALAFSPDGKQFVTGSKDHSLKLFTTVDGKLVREFKFVKDKEKGHTDAVISIAFSPDGSRIVSGSADKTIKVWNVADGKVVQEFGNPSHPGWVYGVAYIDGGKKLVSVGGALRLQGYLATWDTSTGKLLSGKEYNLGTMFALGVSPDGKVMGIGTGGSIRATRDLNRALLMKVP
jgi:WD40 repeat protein